MRRAGGRVLVPEGWSRGRDARSRWSRARWSRSSPSAAIATRYTSPDGVTLKSNGVNKYLSARPEIDARARFLFETKPEDVPPARLVAPNALAHALGREEKENAGRAGREETGGMREPPPFASAPKTKHAKGTGARDATGKTPEPERDIAGNGRVSARDAARGVAWENRRRSSLCLTRARVRSPWTPIDSTRGRAGLLGVRWQGRFEGRGTSGNPSAVRVSCCRWSRRWAWSGAPADTARTLRHSQGETTQGA